MAENVGLPAGFQLDASPLPGLPQGFMLDQAGPAKSDSSFLKDVGHAASVTGRDILSGVAALPLAAADLATGAVNIGRRALGAEPWPSASENFQQGLTAGGLDQPQNNAEHLASTATRGAVSAATGAGMANQAAGLITNPVSQGVAETLAAQPGLQAVSGASAGIGGEIARQNGAGPGGQVAASMAAGALPAIISAGGPALIKWILRGGEEGRQAASNVVDTFAQAGETPTIGQATGSRTYQGAESMLSRVPGGAGPMIKKGVSLQENLANKVEDMANNLAPKANPEQAGRAIYKGITGENSKTAGDAFMVRSRAVQGALYDKLDNYIPTNTEVAATNTQAAIERMTAPIIGAENTSRSPLLSNSTMNNLGDSLQADMGWKSQSGALSDGITSFVAPKDTMPYQALKEIRSRIGQKLSDIDLAPDVPKAQLKQLYGALSQDMEMAAKDAGPEAYKAFRRANGYTAALHDRIDLLQSVIDKNGGPEKIFNAATSGTRDGATILRGVMKSLPEDGQKMLSASILRRMGKALPGAQNDTGDLFSTERFLTSWNTMSPEAKQATFSRYGTSFNKDMDALASIAANLRAGSKVFANPSGTAQVISQQAAWYTTIGALLTGHPAVAGTEAGLIGSANLAARALTSPKIVNWMVKTTEKPIGTLPAQINNLATWAKNQNDPDAAAMADYLKQSESQSKQGTKSE